MTDTKCPFCNGKLLNSGRIHKDGTHEILYQRCDDCKIKDSDPKLWQELITTRKALDIAVDGITYMRNNCLDYAADYMDYADGILEQINEIKGGKNGV